MSLVEPGRPNFGRMCRVAVTASILGCSLVPVTANAGPDDCLAGRVVQRQVYPRDFGNAIEVVASSSGNPLRDSCPADVTASAAAGILYKKTFEARDVMFRFVRVGGTPMLDIATYDGGGSTSHRSHTLLLIRHGRLVEVLSTVDLQDQDGFFVGDLGWRDRVGVAIWGPNWDEPVAHHAPRHYRVQEYQLAGTRLIRVRNYLSESLMMLGSDAAAALLGLPFKDAGPWRLASNGLWEKQP